MAAPKPSRFPPDGSAIDALDKRLTSIISAVRLPFALEIVFSIPGCWFGIPSFMPALALLACVVVDGPTEALVRAFVVAFVPLAALWVAFLTVRKPVFKKLLFSPPALAGGPVLGSWRAACLDARRGG